MLSDEEKAWLAEVDTKIERAVQSKGWRYTAEFAMHALETVPRMRTLIDRLELGYGLIKHESDVMFKCLEQAQDRAETLNQALVDIQSERLLRVEVLEQTVVNLQDDVEELQEKLHKLDVDTRHIR